MIRSHLEPPIVTESLEGSIKASGRRMLDEPSIVDLRGQTMDPILLISSSHTHTIDRHFSKFDLCSFPFSASLFHRVHLLVESPIPSKSPCHKDDVHAQIKPREVEDGKQDQRSWRCYKRTNPMFCLEKAPHAQDSKASSPTV